MDPGPGTRVARQGVPAATVTVYPDGPLVLRGDVEIREVDGTSTLSCRLVALCRCGRSALKPLCDGNHKNGVHRDRGPGITTATG